MQKLLMEFIGTFFLTFTVSMVVLDPPAGILGPVAIGLVLSILVYAGGYISGGLYNPAVTLGAFMRHSLKGVDVIPYFLAQGLGALAAALWVPLYKPFFDSVPAMLIDLENSITVEFFFTFLLVFVVLQTATSKRLKGNQFYGFAIGMTVTVGAIAVGSISGAVFNPAVGLALKYYGLLTDATYFYYLAVQLAAGVCAALIFKFLNPDEE
ncbi:MAG TPA: aquaporin [Oligoflexia bacterium]|nr:aquaporin [Oligoflexia bacterium]HMP26708.1 aquaporin [Oligoflexia bacterium]